MTVTAGAAARGAAALRRRLAPDLHLAEGAGPAGEDSLWFRHHRHGVGDLAIHTLVLGQGRLTLASGQRFCLVLPLAGEATLWPGTGHRRSTIIADAGQAAVLLPPGSFRLRGERLSVALIPIPPPALTQATATLSAGEAELPLAGKQPLCRQWRASAGRPAELLALLRQALRLVESAASSCSEGAARAERAPAGSGLAGKALANWILQTLALLLLLEPETSAAKAQSDDAPERRLEALIAHIETHLHRPLSLEELSERGGCSRRALQYAFQRRYGCGPMQWVRRRRLEAARLALQEADPSESVARIARRCGYINLSSFSRDILRAYGRPPSALRPGGLWPEG